MVRAIDTTMWDHGMDPKGLHKVGRTAFAGLSLVCCVCGVGRWRRQVASEHHLFQAAAGWREVSNSRNAPLCKQPPPVRPHLPPRGRRRRLRRLVLLLGLAPLLPAVAPAQLPERRQAPEHDY